MHRIRGESVASTFIDNSANKLGTEDRSLSLDAAGYFESLAHHVS